MIQPLISFPRLESRGIDPLTNSRPLWQLCLTQLSVTVQHDIGSQSISTHTQQNIEVDSLCTPFLYVFSFRSNIVYLSLGTISSSLGISFFHLSTAFAVIPFLANALSTIEMTSSTMRSRLR